MEPWTAASARATRASVRRSAPPTAAAASSCSPTSAARCSPRARFSPTTTRDDVRLVDAPFVEGAVAATVLASTGADLDAVCDAAREARHVAKL